MKKLFCSITFLMFIFTCFSQFQPSFLPKDSVVLKNNPYFFKDIKRPYKKDPKTWSNYPKTISTNEQAATEIEKAKKENDFYRVFQIATLGLFKDEKARVDAFYAAEFHAYLYQDPWLLLHITNYLIEHPVTGYSDMKTSFVAGVTYNSAMSQKDPEALYAIAALQKSTSLISDVSESTILENAKKFEQKPIIKSEGKPSISKKEKPNVAQISTKHIGKALSGDIINGKGVKLYTKKDSLVKEGWKYEGNFINGVESGIGLLYDCNGKLIYNGNWGNGLFNGEGELTTSTEKYKGGFINGKKHGKGSFENLIDSNKYVGDYSFGLANGSGVYYYKDGSRYVGDFKNGLFNGKGRLYMTGNLSFEGAIKDSKWEGSGIYYLENGKAEGNFSEGSLNGSYVVTKKDGSVYNVTFKNNQIVTSTLISSPKNSINIKRIFESVWNGTSRTRSDLMKSGYIACEEKLFNIQFVEITNSLTGISLSTVTLNGQKYQCKNNISGTYNPNNKKVEIRTTGRIFADPLPNNLSWALNTVIKVELGQNANNDGSFLLQGKTSNQRFSDEYISYKNR